MRRSLLLRLLGLALTVALLSISATAWLTMRDTGERLRAEFATTFEADFHIQQELLTYAVRNESWEGVGPLLRRLSEQTGRRIALTTTGGDLIADSTGGTADSLPDDPVAKIDATSTELPIAGDMSTWRLTNAESARRKTLISQAQACIKEKDPDAELLITEDGGFFPQRVVPFGETEHGTPAPHADVERRDTSVLDECVPDELHEPSAAGRKVLSRFNDLRADCRENRDLPTDQHLPSNTPQSGPVDISDDVVEGDVESAYTECEIVAMQKAIEPFVATPALLYTGSSDRFDPFSDGGWQRTVLTGLAILVVAAGLTVLAGRRLTRPIRGLTLAAQRMGRGDRTARVRVTGADEVARLGTAFNAMADSIDAGERQRKNMVADIAHELRNPLANVRGYLEAAEDGVVALDHELLTSLREESDHLRHLVDDLSVLALADAGELPLHPEDCDTTGLAAGVVAAHQRAADATGVTLSVDANGPVMVFADPKRLRQAVSNLVGNAVRYTQSDGTVTVRVFVSDGDAVIKVADNGAGIPASDLPHVFDRFYRVERSRSRATGGSGLGLAITRKLVEAIGGEVSVASTVGEGSTFTIRIPSSHSADD